MTKSEKKANNAIPRQTLKICRGYLFVYSGAIINQLPISSPLILHDLCLALFVFWRYNVNIKGGNMMADSESGALYRGRRFGVPYHLKTRC